ncbi:thiamine pyrophosphate-dependent enzyme [Actinomyces radicidentis]|nr:thiamine pyrophosphate-dependent enzyme [Actinomyces radicidentis]
MEKLAGEQFVATLVELGMTRFTGVPCSTFKGLFHAPELKYLPAPHEGLAYAWAVGGHLAGRPTGVISQNSGVGNLINALTSLALPCDVPVFSLVSLRGYPTPESDEAQHVVMGGATEGILRETGAMVQVMDAACYADQMDELLHGTQPKPRFLLVPKGMLVWEAASPVRDDERARRPMSAMDVARVVAEVRPPEVATFATTGFSSRYLASFGDLPTNFYMQGSMGHVPALAAGFAAASGQPVVILDGDGALAMHPGAMSLVGRAGLHVVHVVVDNGTYASTGSQALPMVPQWHQLAQAYQYDHCADVSNAVDLAEALRAAVEGAGATLIVARTNDDVCNDVPRASTLIRMNDMFTRLQTEVARR